MTDLSIELKNDLVKRAEDVANCARNAEGDRRPQTSQLRNLLQIVQEESEVLVLANFIRYQAGRKATKRFWEPIYQKVIEDLKVIQGSPALQDLGTRRLALQRYFGYMIRHYVYRAGTDQASSNPNSPSNSDHE